jgi:protein-disulfide isomerase
MVLLWRLVLGKPGIDKAARATERPAPTEPISLDGLAVRGDHTASVVMVVYSDFECAFCGRFARDVLPTIHRDYIRTNKVALLFAHFPLLRIHPNAARVAEAVECAGTQGKFWEMHDLFFSDPKRSNSQPARFLASANAIGLELVGFRDCLEKGRMRARVDDSLSKARQLGVVATPTTMVGLRQPDGTARMLRRLDGARSIPEVRAALDDAVVQARRRD